MSTPTATSGPIIVGTSARPLLGKCALVTGGSRGIGAAICLALGQAGADVVLSYSASEEEALKVAALVEATGVRCFALKADQSVQEEVTALVASAVAKLGKLDVLVNNAGIFGFSLVTAPLSESTLDQAKVWAVNVTAVATAVRAVVNHMPAGGRIINIGSIGAQSAFMAGAGDYCATKAALVGYTKGWARDLGAKGITVNLVQPGHIQTAMNPVGGPLTPFALSAPAARHGTPEEVAAAVLFLATPAASFINAAVLNVDGGFTA